MSYHGHHGSSQQWTVTTTVILNNLLDTHSELAQDRCHAPWEDMSKSIFTADSAPMKY